MLIVENTKITLANFRKKFNMTILKQNTILLKITTVTNVNQS